MGNTLDKCSQIAGIVPPDADGNPDTKKAFMPLFHTTMKTHIEVILDKEGNLVDIKRDGKEQTIIVPCTEEDCGKTNNIVPKALFDELQYIDKNFNSKKYKAYISLLKKWKGDNAKLNAIYAFLEKNSLVEIMRQKGVFKENEIKEGIPVAEKIKKLGVRFSVYVPGDVISNVWEDETIQEEWIEYMKSIDSKIDSFDYLSGKPIKLIAKKHPQYVDVAGSKARLISCNDDDGLTYRGRFANQDEAITIDAESSQKLHIALKWLNENYGVSIDNQTILVFAIGKQEEESIKPYETLLIYLEV